MVDPAEDWNQVLERLLRGDRAAFLRFNRLVTGFLLQLRAYDFEEEWDDLRQEVVTAVVQNARAGRLRDPQALVGYARIITRNKFTDRLKRRLRCRERESLPWEEETARVAAVPVASVGPDQRRDLRAALAALPSDQRRLVEGVYLEGKTYQEVASETGVPLGTLKRHLRAGLAALRQRLESPLEES